MLVRLLRSYLDAYRPLLAAVVVLQLVGTLAMLYLPSLNADIIDNGVAKGDTGYILRVGRVMLAVTLVQVACAIACGLLRRADRDGLRSRRPGGRLPPRRHLLAREVNGFGAPSLITRTTNDVQQVQMLVLLTCTVMVSAPIMCVGGIVMALREDLGLSWLIVVSVAVLVAAIGAIVIADGPAVPADAGAHRRRQPGAARADHRHPGRAGLRPRAGRAGALRRRQRRADRHRAAGRAADGAACSRS